MTKNQQQQQQQKNQLSETYMLYPLCYEKCRLDESFQPMEKLSEAI